MCQRSTPRWQTCVPTRPFVPHDQPQPDLADLDYELLYEYFSYTGAKAIKYHLDYMAGLLDQRRWLAGNEMTMADFAAAAQLSCLDYISDVDWNRSDVIKDWYAKIKSRPAFRSLLADQVPGFPQPAHYADLDF